MKKLFLATIISLISLTTLASEITTHNSSLQADLVRRIAIALDDVDADNFNNVRVDLDAQTLATQDLLAIGASLSMNQYQHSMKAKAGFAFYNDDGAIVAILATVGAASNRVAPNDDMKEASPSIGIELALTTYENGLVASVEFYPHISAIKLSTMIQRNYNYLDISLEAAILKSLENSDMAANIYGEVSYSFMPNMQFFAGFGVDYVKTFSANLTLGIRLKLDHIKRERTLDLEE